MTVPITADLEAKIKACFKTDVQSTWYGGTPKKVGTDQNKLYIAIHEDENWWTNKCVLKDWYFDYDEFKKLSVRMDCEQYGVFVFWKN